MTPWMTVPRRQLDALRRAHHPTIRDIQRIFVDTTLLSAGTYVAGLLNAGVYVLAARYLHPANLGIAASGVALATLACTAADFGLNGWAIRAIAAEPDDARPYTDNLSAKTAIALTVTAVGFLAAAVVQRSLLLAPLLFAAMLAESTFLVPFRATRRMGTVAAITVADRLIALTCVLAMSVSREVSIDSFLGSLCVGSVAATTLCWFLLPGAYRALRRPSFQQIPALFRSSLGFGAAGMFAQLQRLDVPIVGLMAGAATGGLYAAPARIVNLLGALPSALSATLLPTIASRKDSTGTKHAAVAATGLVLTLVVVILTATYILAPEIVTTVLGPAYLSSAPVLRVFLIGMIPGSLNQPLAAYLQARGQDRHVAVAIGIGSILGLAAVAVATAFIGAVGGAFGFLVLQAAILIALVRAIRSRARWLVVSPDNSTQPAVDLGY